MNQNINTAEYWDNIHSLKEEWRTYPNTFEMISNEVGSNQRVIEFGCGTGILAEILGRNSNAVLGIDISKEAAIQFNKRNRQFDILAYSADLVSMPLVNVPRGSIAIATEFLEHFKDEELEIIMTKIVYSADKAIFCVPNDCLGNDVCKEHYQKWSKKSFKEFLLKYYTKVLVISFIEKFVAKDQTIIQLPTLMAVCEGGLKSE